jgi:predicted Zn-dependent protease
MVGCQSLQPAPAEMARPAQLRAQLDGSIRYDTNDQQVAELWSAAEDARRNDNDDEALELLYKALDLSPENSILWSRAAELQLDNDQALMAENLALKSNAYAGDNPAILHRNWLIIEHARSLRGDLLGVRSARKRVQQFQYQ